MKWIKASERLPEGTSGVAKDIVYKQHLDSGTRLKVSTVNQFLDTLKYRILEKFEWLDESPSSEVKEQQGVEQGSIYWYQPLFDLMSKEHDKILVKSEMDDIIITVQKMLNQ